MAARGAVNARPRPLVILRPTIAVPPTLCTSQSVSGQRTAVQNFDREALAMRGPEGKCRGAGDLIFVNPTIGPAMDAARQAGG